MALKALALIFRAIPMTIYSLFSTMSVIVNFSQITTITSWAVAQIVNCPSGKPRMINKARMSMVTKMTKITVWVNFKLPSHLLQWIHPLLKTVAINQWFTPRLLPASATLHLKKSQFKEDKPKWFIWHKNKSGESIQTLSKLVKKLSRITTCHRKKLKCLKPQKDILTAANLTITNSISKIWRLAIHRCRYRLRWAHQKLSSRVPSNLHYP